MEALGRLLQPMRRWWQQASGTQRAAVGLFLVLSAALLIGVGVLASRPSYAVLYSNLRTDDAGAVVGALKEMKVPYRLAEGGSRIEVASDQVYEARLDLAGKGLPRGGNVGFEIFDRSQMGLSEFTEKLNYQRALQGELSRTISELQPVEYARVHLVLPEERLYSSEQKPVTASVVLAMRPGAAVSQPQIRSIVHLVSSSVEGLKPENVTVVDTAGELLSAQVDVAGGPASPLAAASHLRLEREFESQVARSIESMLEEVLGAGRAVVRVNAKLNFDQEQTEEETYQPAQGEEGGPHGVLAQEEQVQETYAGGKALPSGIPGIASNTAGRAAPQISGGADSYQRVESKTEYRVSRRINRITAQPGQVERMSVAVFVDGDLKPTQVAQIRETVTAAAGLDVSRGDQIIVQGARFSTGASKQDQEARQLASRRSLISLAKDGAAAVLLLVFLLFARSAFRLKQPAETEPVAAEVTPEARPLGGYAAAAVGGKGPAQVGEGEAPVSPLAELTQADSEGLAHSIRSWLAQAQPQEES